VGSVGMLLVLLFFIYACAAVQIFGTMDCTDEVEGEEMEPFASGCEGLSDQANFKSWPLAMLTLFRLCTGDAGAAMLLDALRQSPNCDDGNECEKHCCAQAPRPVVPVFFMSFTVLAAFIMLNVVVAVLMGQLEEEQAAMEDEILKQMEKEKREAEILARGENRPPQDDPDGAAAEMAVISASRRASQEFATVPGPAVSALAFSANVGHGTRGSHPSVMVQRQHLEHGAAPGGEVLQPVANMGAMGSPVPGAIGDAAPFAQAERLDVKDSLAGPQGAQQRQGPPAQSP